MVHAWYLGYISNPSLNTQSCIRHLFVVRISAFPSWLFGIWEGEAVSVVVVKKLLMFLSGILKSECTTEEFPIAGLGTYYLDWVSNRIASVQNHGFERVSILPVGDICLPMKYEPITGLYQNFIKFIPNSNRLRSRSANHQGSGPYNQGCVFPFVYKGKENKMSKMGPLLTTGNPHGGFLVVSWCCNFDGPPK